MKDPGYAGRVELDQAAELTAAERCLAADPLATAGPPPPLTDLPEAERRLALVGETARFAAAFLRWTEARAGDGLPYTRLRLLQTLHCDGPAIMRNLGDQLGVSPRNMTAMVDALEDAGLVVRQPHPTDRRATLVELTASGRHEADQVLGPRLEAMAELFEGFSAAEQEAFSTALRRLGAAMGGRPQGAC
jgi:DNA-binding MarR family transcriptional regulator